MTHVLVARMDSEGDVLLAGPAVRAAARTPIGSRCSVAAGPACSELLPGVDEVPYTTRRGSTSTPARSTARAPKRSWTSSRRGVSTARQS